MNTLQPQGHNHKVKTEARASQEHLELSTFIKDVHKKLRSDAYKHGWEQTWKEHVNNDEMLAQYAVAMELLACKHWKDNQDKANSKAISRIAWIHHQCQDYFSNKLSKLRQQEEAIAEKCDFATNVHYLKVPQKLKLLDVGSCYNPFKQYNDYDVVAIDIAPRNLEVKQCDFLNVTVQPIQSNDDLKNQTTSLPFIKESYHIIVFSLLLDYLPTPELRLKCCENAYELLTREGILLIISPDAKHVGANAKYMKSWRLVLARIGFRRVVYEKLPYIHCMVFRKSNNANVAKRWATIHVNEKLYDKLYIPQDFSYESE